MEVENEGPLKTKKVYQPEIRRGTYEYSKLTKKYGKISHARKLEEGRWCRANGFFILQNKTQSSSMNFSHERIIFMWPAYDTINQVLKK